MTQKTVKMISLQHFDILNHPVPRTLTTTSTFADAGISNGNPVDPNNVHERLKLIILVPITTLIVVSNLVVLSYILFHKQFHKPTYLFVTSLAIADLFVGCVAIATIVNPNDDILELCLTRIGFVISACVASIYCMMWIAIDRYIAIIHPLRYNQKVTFRRAACILVLVWGKCFLVGFAPLMGWNVGVYHNYCSVAYVVSPSYLVFLFGMGFAIPMLVITVVYCKLYKLGRIQLKRIVAVEIIVAQSGTTYHHSEHHTSISRRNWKSVRIVMILIGCYVVTWAPFIVTALAQVICGDDKCHLKDIIGSYLLLLGFTNSFLNPVIYAISNKEFKQKFCRSFSSCCKQRIRPFLQSSV